MTTYYIDPSSGTNGNGLSESTPFNTWTAVTWAYGNKYLQKGGTTYLATITISPSSSATNKSDGIVVGAYGTGRAILDGQNTLASGILFNPANQIQYTTIQDFEVKNILPSGAGKGIELYCYSSTGNNLVQNCYIHHCGSNCIYINKAWAKIKNCILEYAGDDCVYVGTDVGVVFPVEITDCTMRYPSQRLSSGDCIQIIEDDFEYVYIARNNFVTHGTVKQCVMISATGNTPVVVENNTFDCESVGRAGVSCSVAKLYIVRGNTFKNINSPTSANAVNAYDNPAEISVYTGPEVSYIYGNLFINCAQAIGCSGTNTVPARKKLYIADNTIINSNIGMRLYGNADVYMYNNIIGTNGVNGPDGTAQAIYVQSSINLLTEDKNCIYPEYSGVIKDYRSGINLTFDTVSSYLAHANVPDSDSFSSDPLLGANYAPAVGSPCLSTGVKWWSNARPFDVNGEPYPNVDIDIGAIQSTTNSFHPSNIK